MSGPIDRKEKKRLARAEDDLRRGLSRRNASTAVAGFLELPSASRDEHARAVSALVADEIARLRRGKQWAEVARLGAAIEAETRLLTREPETAAEVRWSLVWGFALSGSFARARAVWSALDAATGAGDPALARAMTEWLATDGNPLGEAFVRFEEAASGLVDPRMGLESVRPKMAKLACPSLPADVPASIAQAFASMLWRDFAMTVRHWLDEAVADARPEIHRAMSEIALWEASRRASVKGADVLGPLLSWAHCMRSPFHRASGSAAAESQVVDAVRLALRAISDRSAGSDADAKAAATIVCAAIAGSTSGDVIVDAVTASELASEPLAALVVAVHEEHPDARLWWKQAALFVKQRSKERRGNVLQGSELDRLARGFRRALQGPRSLASVCRAADHRERAWISSLIYDLFPLDDIAAYIDGVWDALPDDERREAARAICDELDVGEPYYCPDCDVLHGGGVARVADLDGDARRIWAKVGDRVGTWHMRLLPLWAEQRSGDEIAAALASHAERERSIDGWLVVLAFAAKRRLRKAEGALVSRMLVRFADDLESLARAALSPGASSVVRARAAEALTAGARVSGRPASPLVTRALERIDRSAKLRARKTRPKQKARKVESLQLPLEMGK